MLEFGWGPASMAGERGPDLRELESPAEEKPHAYAGSEGELRASMGGRVGFALSSRSAAFEAGRDSSWEEREAEERVAESGLFC